MENNKTGLCLVVFFSAEDVSLYSCLFVPTAPPPFLLCLLLVLLLSLSFAQKICFGFFLAGLPPGVALRVRVRACVRVGNEGSKQPLYLLSSPFFSQTSSNSSPRLRSILIEILYHRCERAYDRTIYVYSIYMRFMDNVDNNKGVVGRTRLNKTAGHFKQPEQKKLKL